MQDRCRRLACPVMARNEFRPDVCSLKGLMAVRRLEPRADDRAEALLPSRFGTFRIAVFRIAGDETEVVAMIHGDVRTLDPVLVRLHSECLTGESLGSLRCDCGDQLSTA